MKTLYSLTIALSAALLFSVEPMAARALLPVLGGSAAVWLTALTFFQITLLLGYAYSRYAGLAGAAAPGPLRVHLVVLALAALWVLVPSGAAMQAHAGHPQVDAFLLLARQIGLPFAVLCTTAPLLQLWYARRERTAVPYRLFGLSNLASLAALLAYPFVIETHLGLHQQAIVWRAAFLLYLLLMAGLTLRMRAAPADGAPIAAIAPEQPASSRAKLLWLALPAVASLTLTAVTEHLTQDIASVPLLWVVPLAVYLLSFVLAFDLPQLYRRPVVLRLMAVLLLALGYFLAQVGMSVPLAVSVPLFTAALFAVSWFCHAELFALRPATPGAAATFYLAIAAGGALGTLAIAVLSPLLTDTNFDLPLAFLLTAAATLAVVWHSGWAQRLFWLTALGLGIWLLVVLQTASERGALFRSRNFYGSVRVRESQLPPQAFLSRSLYNGAIQHGMQWFSTDFRRTPLTYYAPDSGIGRLLGEPAAEMASRRIGVIGLGAGTLAAYGHAGDVVRFYEINPTIIDVAQHLFTYTRDTPAHVEFVAGDARLSLASERGMPPFDVLVVDAFSGDSIPTHLLTWEALQLYRRRLTPGGVLAFHISNQHLDLAPVLARLAVEGGSPLQGVEVDSAPNAARGEAQASWVLLSADPSALNRPALAEAGRPLRLDPRVKLWTDDTWSLLPVIRWNGRHVSPRLPGR